MARFGIRLLLLAALALPAATAPAAPAPAAPAENPTDPGLQVFRDWLDQEHPGYGCDEGPARFRNRTVDAAYPDQRFYYVLTYTRGIPPPYQKSLSLVAAIDDGGRVVPFGVISPQTYRSGLKQVTSGKDAKLAAAAVLILASCDPGERRWPYKPERFKVKKDSKGWICSYKYDKYHSSWVRFDREGLFLEFGGSAPPVP